MSQYAELLAGRRMCRDFDPAPLDDGVVEKLADAASRAPSAGNTHFLDLLVLEGERTAEYWDLTLPSERRDEFPWPGLLAAPLLLCAYVDPSAYVRRYGEADKVSTALASTEAWSVPYWFVDGGAAVMALLLAAEDLGLGALFFGQFRHEAALKVAFGIPGDRRALGTVAVGRPAPGGSRRSTSARRGRPDVAAMLHRGRW